MTARVARGDLEVAAPDGRTLRFPAVWLRDNLDPRGRIRGVRFNNRSTRPLRLPPAEVTAFYAAYRRWATLLARPELALTMRLRPGDCLIFDNTRILHGRTAFTGAGQRLLQGCYADLDGLASSLAVLEGVAA